MVPVTKVKLIISSWHGADCLHVYGMLVFGDKMIELTRKITEKDFETAAFEGYKKHERTIRFWKTEDVISTAKRYCKHLFKKYELEVIYEK